MNKRFSILSFKYAFEGLAAALKERKIHAVFHYLSLHTSPYYAKKYTGRELFWSDKYSDCLLRLPMYFDLKEGEINYIVDTINKFYEKLPNVISTDRQGIFKNLYHKSKITQ